MNIKYNNKYIKEHTYIIPYYKINNKIFILVGTKKIFGNIDGFIHNNAGQRVLIGGHLDKNQMKKKNIIKEFNEETGYKIDIEKLNIIIKTKYYTTFSYKCSKKEFEKFKTLNLNNEKNKGHKKYIELTNLKWIDINNVENDIEKYNYNVIKNFNKYVNMYIKNLLKNIKKDNNKWFPKTELKYFINSQRKRYLYLKDKSPKEILKDTYIKLNDNNYMYKKNIINKMKENLLETFKKRSFFDWFIESIKEFKYQSDSKHLSSVFKELKL